MELDEPSGTKVHQLLFGYDDGHRPLASSIRLPPATASLVLLLSTPIRKYGDVFLKPIW
jgi:hypothetical protein